MSPRFDETDMESFYSETYRVLYSGDAGPTLTSIEQQRLRAEHLAKLIKEHVSEAITSHLDIGSSTGLLLQSVKSLFPQVHSVGIEPSHAYRTWCLEQGIDAYPSLEDMQNHMDSPKFQLITVSHVLEHLPEPVAYLEILRSQFLAPNGVILIEVPNLFGHKSFELAHLFCFSKKTLFDILTVAGFQIAYYRVHSIPRNYSGGKMYLTVIANKSNNTEKAERQVKPVWWRGIKIRRELYALRFTWETLVKIPFKIRRRITSFLVIRAK